MRMIKMALLGGAAMAVTAAGAHANDLDALKAQIEELNTRMAAMETAPSVPAGYQLIAVSEGELQQAPGLGMTARELAAYGNKATIISVLPTADAPAGTTISWSGFARAGLVYENSSVDYSADVLDADGESVGTLDLDGDPDTDPIDLPLSVDSDEDDIDVKARGEIRVKAATDTAVGEVGVDIRLRGNFNGNGNADAYMDVAWGYWSMTPELTFGGGYAGSLGNIGYGYDGACTCHYTDNADLAFDPGDTTQMRLSYASGPISFAVALEDASARLGADDFGANDAGVNGDRLGAAGEMKYSGDAFSGEVSAVWRDTDEDATGSDARWQVGAGLGFGLGDIANLSIAAAMGEGPTTVVDEGEIVAGAPYNQSYWGVTALASFKMTDEMHVELAGGYKNREGDEFDVAVELGGDLDGDWSSDGAEYETYGVMGGIYYTPVDQLTIGVEAEWYTTSLELTLDESIDADARSVEIERDADTFSIDLVSVWRF
jgi:hypothetical protein